MPRLGNIYLITDKTNGMKYVGQTCRDIDTRFAEHCTEKRGYSKLHKAIQEKGWRNFSVSLIEQVPLNKLDEREIYWIKELDTQKSGYNTSPSGTWIYYEYPKVRVKENNLIFDSKEDMCRLFNSVTSWSSKFLSEKFKQVIENEQEFLGYHFESILGSEYEVSDDDVLIDWIKTLNIRFQGKHIYCVELDKEFSTIAEAAKYLIDNSLYVTTSKTPIQSLVTSIGKNVNGKIEYIKGVTINYHFEFAPGATKQIETINHFQSNKIYCPELDKTFDNQIEVAHYFIDNNIWTGIKFKTAKLRISDIVRGAFPDYKGYTFKEIE